MATIFKSGDRDFQENPDRIDPFRLYTDASIPRKGLHPQNLNFDLRRLDPGQYSTIYHFHHHAEELFMILSGSATLRTPEGLEEVEAGDLLFFEMGETGAHQLYNHTAEPCTFLDIRTFTGVDVCEYPDSDKILIVPPTVRFRKADQVDYFDGEQGIRERWEQLPRKKE